MLAIFYPEHMELSIDCPGVLMKVLILLQDCKWEFLVFSGNFGAELSVREDQQRANLTFSLIRSSFMNSFVGQWQVSSESQARHPQATQQTRRIGAPVNLALAES